MQPARVWASSESVPSSWPRRIKTSASIVRLSVCFIAEPSLAERILCAVATRFGPVAGPGGPTFCGNQRAAMNAWLTPLMFIVKQPCSMAEWPPTPEPSVPQMLPPRALTSERMP
jgi:hypothetical protein